MEKIHPKNNVSIYDVGCLSFLEAALSGCHCFAWDLHPMFDQYPVHRFTDYDDGARVISNVFEEKGVCIAEELMRYVAERHSYPAFVSNLKKLSAEVLLDV